MYSVVDKFGLVSDGNYLTVFLPAKEVAFVFRVKARLNNGYEVLNYGPLPLSSGTTLPTYEGSSSSVPASGVLPARTFTQTGITFPYTGAYDETDMWYVTEEYRDLLFHVKQYIEPAWIRIDVQIPKGVTQGRFQRNKIITGVDKEFGFMRGFFETVHFPRIHYGYRYGNDTNMSVYTKVKFVYAEYLVEIPDNPELIFNILTKKVPSYWVTLPIHVWDPTIDSALKKTYNIIGFPIYREDQKDKAISEYKALLSKVKEVM